MISLDTSKEIHATWKEIRSLFRLSELDVSENNQFEKLKHNLIKYSGLSGDNTRASVVAMLDNLV